MNITCDNCLKQYQMDPAIIKGAFAKTICKKCQHTIIIYKPDTSASNKNHYFSSNDSFNDINEPSRTIVESEDIKEAKPGSAGNPLTIKRTDGLQFRVGSILVLLTTLILAGYVCINYFYTKDKMTSDLTTASKNTADRLALTLADPLWALDEKQIDKIITSEMKEKQIQGFIVKDAHDQSVVNGKTRDTSWRLIDTKDDRINGETIFTQADVAKGDEKTGIVAVYYTKNFMQDATKKNTIFIAVTATVLNIAIFITVFLALKQLVITHITDLTQAAEKMSLGEMDVNLNVSTKNEIGILTEAIKRMQSSLKLAFERLSRKF